MPGSRSYDYDIAILADFRYPGGTSVSMAEEIKAQAAAGYTTALVPMTTPQLKKRRRFHPQIINCVQSDMAELVESDAELRVKLLTMRHPALFTEEPDPRPSIDADVVVMVANQTPTDETEPGGTFYYDVAEAEHRLQGLFGQQPLWAPIGPQVRGALDDSGVALEITSSDWHNVLDTDEWWVDRTRYVADRPVIGRHARPHWKKWPDTAAEILAAYPDDPSVWVKILGGGEVAAKIVGRVPPNWTLYPFNSINPTRFLRELDFVAYYHHPRWIEAFGRTIVEALASACPTIVPHHFQGLFEDACIYASPDQVLETVQRLYRDPESYRDHAERGHEFAKRNFGHDVHSQRIERLIGPPSHAPRSSPGSRRQDSILFFSAEGFGPLNRTLAIARRLPESVTPILVTHSVGMKAAVEAGYACEYIPSGDGGRWHEFLQQRLAEIIGRYGAKCVVFDGSRPSGGLIGAGAMTGVPLAWVRRAMWPQGSGGRSLDQAPYFNLIIEPGELAAAYDRGATPRQRSTAVHVPPILLLDNNDLLPTTEARSELGLEMASRAVLVADGWSDGGVLARRVAERILELPGTEVVLADWRPGSGEALPAQVKPVSAFPLSRYLNAFDFAVSGAGYNSFHELLAYEVPAIFVPLATDLDDQEARSRYAEESGAALNLDPFSPHGLDRCLELMLDDRRRSAMRERCREVFPGNGAGEATDALLRSMMRPRRDKALA
jgi:hypothetical protein